VLQFVLQFVLQVVSWRERKWEGDRNKEIRCFFVERASVCNWESLCACVLCVSVCVDCCQNKGVESCDPTGLCCGKSPLWYDRSVMLCIIWYLSRSIHLYLYISIYGCIYKYLYIYVCVSIHVYIHINIFIYMHIYRLFFLNTYTYLQSIQVWFLIYLCVHVCTYEHAYTYTCIYTNICHDALREVAW